MGKIKLNLPIKGDKETKNLNVLFDTGASTNYIPKTIAERVCTIDKYPQKEFVTLADGKTKISIIGHCDFSTKIYGKYYVSGQADVMDTDKLHETDMYIGAPLMEQNSIKIVLGKKDKKGEPYDYLDFTDYKNRRSI